MTDKEKDAVWRSLPENIKEEVKKAYKRNVNALNQDYAMGYRFASEYIFPSRNLTAEEEKPKKNDVDGKFHVGDKVVTVDYCPLYGKGWIGTVVCCHESDVDVSFGLEVIPHIALCDLAPCTEQELSLSAEKIREREEEIQKAAAEHLYRLNHPEKDYTYEVTLDKIKVNDEWQQYRMELAKEVTIAMIRSVGRVRDSEVFEIVDGIVERLKGENNG